MKTNIKKAGLALIAAVLLIGLVFSGAASAAIHDVGTPDDLDNAFVEAYPGDTIKLNASFTMNGIIDVTKDLTLDLNGSSLTAKENTGLFLVNSVITFNLTDSSDGKTGKLVGNGNVTTGGGVHVFQGTFNMTGGSIVDCNASSFGGAVYVLCGSFILSNNACISNCTATYGGAVCVNNGTFDMTDNARISFCNATVYGGAVYFNEGTFNMTGSTITNCTAKYGGAVHIAQGTFNMTGSNIANCTATCDAGAVNVYTAIFNMNGGSITNCSADYGGAVFTYRNESVFNMTGNAKISNCSADNGGAAYVNIGTFTMTDDAKISNCSAYYGGAVYIWHYDAVFIMTDTVSISNCTAESRGGAVYVYKGTFNMTGGVITGCSALSEGSGVFVLNDEDSQFTISGSATITSDNEVALYGYDTVWKNINVTGAFTGSVDNITLYGYYFEDPSVWMNHIVVKNGTGLASKFTLSTSSIYADYVLKADGTDLILSSFKSVYNATEWNALEDVSALYGKIRIVDTAKTASIEPKYLGTDMLTLSNDLTLDFSGYKGTFEGVPAGTDANQGALFGNVSLANGKKLEIIGLKMTTVNVTSSQKCIGGIIGGVSSGSSAGNTVLNLTNCHLVNCSITGENEYVGGLAGFVDNIVLNVDRCSVIHCDVLADKGYVGGLIGGALDNTFSDCLVANTTVATFGERGAYAGGLIGAAGSANFTQCTVRTTSVYETSPQPYCSGGLAGHISDASNTSIVSCEVENCVIVAGSKGDVGGLIGYAGHINNKFRVGTVTSSGVINSTIVGTSQVGGLFGNADYAAASSGNSYKNIAVKGTGDTVGYISGDSALSLVCTPEGTNYLKNQTTMDTITLYTIDGTEISTLPDAGFWKNISYTTGEKDAGSATIVTDLGQYGMPSGYGVGSYVPYTVTVNYDDRKGYAYADADGYKEGDTVTLTAIPYEGYTFKKWTASGISASSIVNNQFTMPANDVTVTAVFESVAHPSGPTDTGSTVILTETVTPTTVPTATPGVNKTVEPTIVPATIPTQTTKSPAPFVGLIAGLGAAAVLLRMRK